MNGKVTNLWQGHFSRHALCHDSYATIDAAYSVTFNMVGAGNLIEMKRIFVSAIAANESGWNYGLSLYRDLSDETDGAVLDGRIGYSHPLTKKITMTTFGSVSVADDHYMQSYFGVSQAQAAASSNARFDAESGIRSVGLGVDLGWSINENWRLGGGLDCPRLSRDPGLGLFRCPGLFEPGDLLLGTA